VPVLCHLPVAHEMDVYPGDRHHPFCRWDAHEGARVGRRVRPVDDHLIALSDDVQDCEGVRIECG
jgi:hypothetical protein